MKDNKIFFPNLDGLRFIAFIMVFLWHTLKTPFELLPVQNFWLQQLFYFFVNGKTGVSIFFVLSGFLITYLILAEIELNGKLDVAKFYIRRSLRIWPLYFIILLLVFIAVPFIMNMAGLNWGHYNMRAWFYFLFIGNFDVLHLYLVNGTDLLASTITWSVAIEEQFYLVWPLLFAFIPAKLYQFIFPVLLLVAYIFRYMHADNEAVLNFHTLSVAGDLAIGGWAGWLGFTNKKMLRFFENQSNKMRITIYMLGIVMLFLVYLSTYNLTHVFGRLVQTIFFCYLILDQNFSNAKWLKFSNNRFMSFWGKYTYGLYLWHPLVLLVIMVFLTKGLHFSLQSISTHLIAAPIGLAASFLISYCSYHFIERYFLNLKNKFAFIKARQD